ncbi:hypothetical protein [Streptomyces lancefieldiae]|uniref:Uncharacterized protein n=1 Tax=Streptomyces lancefieldiae TaxID=3075520 RepID=A0ABU3ALI8_9ACTN|nr:hypothetical protein [Streptomyces sp. DSM 40712]MDT0611064.1 hypothetical protein [Streptomyces sp. DSM 40712]
MSSRRLMPATVRSDSVNRAQEPGGHLDSYCALVEQLGSGRAVFRTRVVNMHGLPGHPT